MNNIGLVLAGGGGKGAYQIGVWKAMIEFGVDKNIKAVSGTSVGALNAALFVQGNYEVAERIYLDISTDQILTLDIVKMLSRLHIGSSVPLNILKYIYSGKTEGIFSRNGMLEIINNQINIDYISNSNVEFFSTCCLLPVYKATYFKINNCSHDRIKRILLASSALPIVFDSVEIDGNQYLDGGIVDNIPIKPLYDSGYSTIIVVHLDRKTIIDKKLYPELNLIEIVPRNNQGDLINGTLDFSREGSRRRINQGYEDAFRILKPLYDFGISQNQIFFNLSEMKKFEQKYKNAKSDILCKRLKIKEEIDSLIKK